MLSWTYIFQNDMQTIVMSVLRSVDFSSLFKTWTQDTALDDTTIGLGGGGSLEIVEVHPVYQNLTSSIVNPKFSQCLLPNLDFLASNTNAEKINRFIMFRHRISIIRRLYCSDSLSQATTETYVKGERSMHVKRGMRRWHWLPLSEHFDYLYVYLLV